MNSTLRSLLIALLALLIPILGALYYVLGIDQKVKAKKEQEDREV